LAVEYHRKCSPQQNLEDRPEFNLDTSIEGEEDLAIDEATGKYIRNPKPEEKLKTHPKIRAKSQNHHHRSNNHANHNNNGIKETSWKRQPPAGRKSSVCSP
jgi:hypothetical protein